MKKSEITYGIQNKRVYLKSGELLEQWGNIITLLFIVAIILIRGIQSELVNREFPIMLIVLLGIGITAILNNIRSRRFEIWKLEVSEQQFKDACIATAKYLEWDIINSQQNFLKAIKGTGWQSEGIRITAIRTENKIYFNSMVEPSLRSNPFSFGWNKKNKTEFRNQLLKAINGEKIVENAEQFQNIEEQKFWNESEWTAKNILKRIIGYGLSVSFIALGTWIILSEELQGIIIGVIVMGISFSYIYYDLKIIRKKKKMKKGGFNKTEI